MAFYDNNNAWSAPGRQASWESQQRTQQAASTPVPSQSDSQSSTSNLRSNPPSALSSPDPNAFASQFEEIERASDNLTKSGRWTPNQASGLSHPSRRDSMPQSGRGHDYANDHRTSGPTRHHSVGGEFDPSRPGSAGLQGFFAGQRFPGGRQTEAEQVLQAKRRMAAQRERELRNYHQEQQYNRNSTVPNVKSDRAMSPNTMSEDERRELIARQHRALYGDGSSLYSTEGGPRASNQDSRASSGVRGPSPLAFDPYGVQSSSGPDGAVQMPPRERPENAASPSSNVPSAQFGLLADPQQHGRNSASSPTASPPLTGGSKGNLGGVAPIGTRPVQNANAVNNINKRSTTPLTPSSLSYGFSSTSDASGKTGKDDRSAPSASASGDKSSSSGLGNWNGNGGGWGSGKNTLAVQPSVWG